MYRCSINFHPFSLSNDITVERYCLPKVGCESRWEHAKDDCEALNESMRWPCPCDIWQGPFFSRASASWGTSRGMIWQMQIHLGQRMMFHSWKLSPKFLWFVTLLHHRCWADPNYLRSVTSDLTCVCVFLWFGWILESFLEVWPLLRPVSVTRYVWFCAFLLEKSFIRLSMLLLRPSRLQNSSVLSQNMFSIFDLNYDLLLHVYNDYIMMINLYIYAQYMCVIYFDVGLPHFGSFQITRKTISINQRGSPSCMCVFQGHDFCLSHWGPKGIYNSLKKWQHENSNVFWCICVFFCQYVDSCPCQYFGCPTKNDQRNSGHKNCPTKKIVQSIDSVGKTQRKFQVGSGTWVDGLGLHSLAGSRAFGPWEWCRGWQVGGT